MTSEPIRDPVTDDLLTPQNAALVVIDYQPSQVGTVRSIDHELLVDNIVSVARLARIFQAGAQPISWVSLACELQRDWARTETVADVVDIVLTTRLLKTAAA